MDETRIHHVNVKVAGLRRARLRGLHRQAGAAGASRSSRSTAPSSLSAQEEYLLALRTRKTLGEAGSASGERRRARARRRAASSSSGTCRASEIDRIEKTRRAVADAHLLLPRERRRDEEGRRRRDEASSAGAMPYEIVDLSRVWVLADVYESELAHVKVGMTATLTLKAFPNRDVRGARRVHRPAARSQDPHGQGPPRLPEPDGRAAPRDVRRGGARGGRRATACASPRTR